MYYPATLESLIKTSGANSETMQSVGESGMKLLEVIVMLTNDAYFQGRVDAMNEVAGR